MLDRHVDVEGARSSIEKAFVWQHGEFDQRRIFLNEICLAVSVFPIQMACVPDDELQAIELTFDARRHEPAQGRVLRRTHLVLYMLP